VTFSWMDAGALVVDATLARFGDGGMSDCGGRG
jgi:hypothetical protein